MVTSPKELEKPLSVDEVDLILCDEFNRETQALVDAENGGQSPSVVASDEREAQYDVQEPQSSNTMKWALTFVGLLLALVVGFVLSQQ